MLYLLNALPNSFLPASGQELTVQGMSEDTVKNFLEEAITEGKFTSAIGFESTAQVLSTRLGVEIPCNRTMVELGENDTAIIAAFTPPRRLEVGEQWTEQEILSFEIKYCWIQ